MILSTTPSIDGREVTAYYGIVAAEVILGANAYRDYVADVVDALGGRNKWYEEVFAAARNSAMEILKEKAVALGAAAVVSIRFDYQILGEKNGMMLVAATGTAVGLGANVRLEARQREAERLEAAQYMVVVDGKNRGPFSTAQIKSLFDTAKVDNDSRVYGDDGMPSTVGEVLEREKVAAG